MKRLNKLLLALFVLFGYFFVANNYSPSIPITVQAASECSIIGNNSASPTVLKASEAEYTLILLRRDGTNINEVAFAINNGNKVIVRLGAGEKPPVQSDGAASSEANTYIDALTRINALVSDKPYLVTASHNEPNCAEDVPFNVEMNFTRKMASFNPGNITWISGQIDYLCGDFNDRGDRSPAEYISGIAAIPNIEGISLPFYAAEAGASDYMLDLLNGAISSAGGKKIYITESGAYIKGAGLPDYDQFLDYAKGIDTLISSGSIEGLMLFNAFGDNSDSDFEYTSPFWKDECRQAFREQCHDPEEVTKICLEDVEDKDPYYVEPIKGMYDYALNDHKDPGNEIFDTIYEDLIAQGYQAYCSIPDIEYLAKNNTNDFMLRNIINDESPGNRIFVQLKDYKQFYNYIDAQAPLWRKQGIYVLKDKDSLENFWSHKDEDKKIGLAPLDFSPAYALTTPEAQCREKKKIMNIIDRKCKTLQDPDTCALDISFDPSSYSYLELYDLIEENNFDCSTMNTDRKLLNPVETAIRYSILRMPYAIPTSYRYAFAIYSAELMEPRILGEEKTTWDQASIKPGFDFLRHTGDDGTDRESNAKPRNEVRILAFLVPDFATNQDNFEFEYTQPPEINYVPIKGSPKNFSGGTTSTHTPSYPAPDFDFHDAIKIARNAIQKPELQQAFLDVWKAKKEDKTIPNPFEEGELVPFVYEGEKEKPKDEKDKYFNYDPDDGGKKLIECLHYFKESADPLYSCVAPMEMALTTFVNRRIENPEICGQDVIDWEENSSIYDNAGISRGDAALFHLYNGNNVHMLDDGLIPNKVANVIDSTSDSSGEAQEDENNKVFEFRFFSHYAFSSFYNGSEGENPKIGKDNKAVIHGYLVYPMGYELEGAEETFLRAFLTPDQIDQFNEEFEEKERSIWFKMKGVVQKFTGKSETYGGWYVNKEEAKCLEDYAQTDGSQPYDGEEGYKKNFCTSQPEATIESEPQENKEPRILGARLGLITIKVQQTLRKIGTPTWDYITSCLESDTPTEDFLTGGCSGTPERDGKPDTESDIDTDYMNTELILVDGVDCGGVNRIVNGIGGYTLPPSEYSCPIDDSITGENSFALEYSDSTHGISNWLSSSDTVNCDQDLFEAVACSFNEETAFKPSLIAHEVDSSGNFKEGTGTTACQYVQDRAAKQNVSPRLALAVWLEETGASAYSTETGGADFGIISAPSSRESGSIEPQLRLFLGTINSNRNIAYPRFLLQYSAEFLYGVDPDLSWREWKQGDPVLFCRNRAFAGRLKNFYEQLGNL